MLVRDCMTTDPVTVTPQTTVLTARRLLHRYGIRHLPVVDASHRVVGVVSARDLAIGDPEVVASLSRQQSELVSGRNRTIETVMTSPAIVALADEPLAVAARLLLSWTIGSLPVVAGGSLVGILTTGDCLKALVGANDDDVRVEQTAADPARR